MKKWLATVLLFGFFFNLHAQPATLPADVLWGAEQRLPSGTRLGSLVLAPGGGFYLLHYKDQGFLSKERAYLEYYDDDLRLGGARKLELNRNGHHYAFEELIVLRNRLYWLLSENDKRNQRKTLYIQPIDRRRLSPEGAPQGIGQTVMATKRRAGAFDLVFSQDSARVLVYSQLPYERNDPERFDLRVYDSDFQPVWQREIALPYRDEIFRVQEYRIDEEGNVYLLGKLFTDDRKRFGFVILAYLDGGARVREYRLAPQSHAISHLTFRIARDSRLVFAGFHTVPGGTRARGTCYFRLDPVTGTEPDFNFRSFNFDFINEFMSEERREAVKEETREGGQRGPRLDNFTITELVLRTDGGALVVAEQRFVEDYAIPFMDGTMQVDYLYHYNDVVIVNIRPDGEVEWAARIPKRQVTRNDAGRYSSYAMSIVRDRLYFVFNDNRFNFEGDRRLSKLHYFNNRSPVMAITEISRDGSLRTFPQFVGIDPGLTLQPRRCRQSGLREMVLYGQGGKSYRLGKLRF